MRIIGLRIFLAVRKDPNTREYRIIEIRKINRGERKRGHSKKKKMEKKKLYSYNICSGGKVVSQTELRLVNTIKPQRAVKRENKDIPLISSPVKFNVN